MKKTVYARQQAATFWVDVRDSLPDAEITVLIHAPNASEPVWLGFHDGEFWRSVDAVALVGTNKVTHWADLPGPPTL